MDVYFHLNKGVVSIPDWHLENYANFRSFDFATEISFIFPLNVNVHILEFPDFV